MDYQCPLLYMELRGRVAYFNVDQKKKHSTSQKIGTETLRRWRKY